MRAVILILSAGVGAGAIGFLQAQLNGSSFLASGLSYIIAGNISTFSAAAYLTLKEAYRVASPQVTR